MTPRKGFTLIELLVSVAIIALLVAILLPTLARARYQAVKTKCLANLHHIGLGFNYYLSEYGEYPLVVNWGYSPPGSVNHPVHYPGQQSGLLALEQNEQFKRDYLRCPTGWASLNRGKNWYTANNDNENNTSTSSANMDYIYWGQRFKPGTTYDVRFASFRYRHRSDENLKILVTDLVQDMTGITDSPQIANRFYGSHNDDIHRVLTKTDGRGNTLASTVEIVARGGSVLFSDNHAEWFDAPRWRNDDSNACFPPSDQW